MSAEDETLHDAVTARVRCDDPDAFISHFLVVAVGATVEGGLTPYYMAFSGGQQPLWQSLGLLEVGKSLLLEHSAED